MALHIRARHLHHRLPTRKHIEHPMSLQASQGPPSSCVKIAYVTVFDNPKTHPHTMTNAS